MGWREALKQAAAAVQQAASALLNNNLLIALSLYFAAGQLRAGMDEAGAQLRAGMEEAGAQLSAGLEGALRAGLEGAARELAAPGAGRDWCRNGLTALSERMAGIQPAVETTTDDA